MIPSPTAPLFPAQSYEPIRTRPTELPNRGVPRLTAALNEALRNQLPPNVRVRPVLPGCDRMQFQYDLSFKSFDASGMLEDSDGTTKFLVQLAPAGVRDAAECQPPRCERRELPGGGTAFLFSPLRANGGIRNQAEIARQDGTAVLLTEDTMPGHRADEAPPTRNEPVLTFDQLVELGSAPGLTLYP